MAEETKTVLPLAKGVVPTGKLHEMRKRALEDPEGFWSEIASELYWKKGWDKVVEGEPPYFKWFVGGKTNLAYNALDRHVKTWRKNKAAIIWEGEPGETRVLTYYQLWKEVNKFANVLRDLGVKKGDRVTIYMPMVPEAAIAMLATVRIGAIHSVVFSGFSAKGLAERINDAQAKVVITADGMYRRGKKLNLKEIVDKALQETPSVESVVVYNRLGLDINMEEGRDYWWNDLMEGAETYAEPEWVESEHPSFILYTSGTTGKPKGIIHDTAGYMVGVYATMKWVFDIKDEDIHWCTADVGWITGHSYVVYGPLLHGATTLMYEGAPDYPKPDRWWSIIEKYGVSIFCTAPTAIRMFMRYGEKWVERHDLSSLRILGSVGEPINPEAWWWYFKHIGKEKCPIVDTWWQTETGHIMISPAPGIELVPLKPGSATFPLPGVDADVVDDNGNPVPPNTRGYLVIKKPWPGMLHGVWGDPERYKRTYWSKFPGWYFTGDYAMKDEDGYFWILGRADDVIKVAGHRLGTMEIESAFVAHPAVAEAAVVGKPHPVKGESIVAFIVLKEGQQPSDELREELRKWIRETIGPVATPDEIHFVTKLPKTRSGKIMRRVLRAVISGKELGDLSTLEDEASVEEVKRAVAQLRKDLGLSE
ncbi:3-hydroxypropionyl-CoA synthetase [Ignicoccus pacificus DSM 13166]|uniref:Acetyl-coenzyme A synthetase n=1 Tax=Ignicoccus pacificus DSM 13166 TaxID=940294 RepID=A0A977K9M8_9CREN|nr:3-hydroxypropionyl-CoA synthetase [Ignicoccus pacificus DSM 13166]